MQGKHLDRKELAVLKETVNKLLLLPEYKEMDEDLDLPTRLTPGEELCQEVKSYEKKSAWQRWWASAEEKASYHKKHEEDIARFLKRLNREPLEEQILVLQDRIKIYQKQGSFQKWWQSDLLIEQRHQQYQKFYLGRILELLEQKLGAQATTESEGQNIANTKITVPLPSVPSGLPRPERKPNKRNTAWSIPYLYKEAITGIKEVLGLNTIWTRATGSLPKAIHPIEGREPNHFASGFRNIITDLYNKWTQPNKNMTSVNMPEFNFTQGYVKIATTPTEVSEKVERVAGQRPAILKDEIIIPEMSNTKSSYAYESGLKTESKYRELIRRIDKVKAMLKQEGKIREKDTAELRGREKAIAAKAAKLEARAAALNVTSARVRWEAAEIAKFEEQMATFMLRMHDVGVSVPLANVTLPLDNPAIAVALASNDQESLTLVTTRREAPKASSPTEAEENKDGERTSTLRKEMAQAIYTSISDYKKAKENGLINALELGPELLRRLLGIKQEEVDKLKEETIKKHKKVLLSLVHPDKLGILFKTADITEEDKLICEAITKELNQLDAERILELCGPEAEEEMKGAITETDPDRKRVAQLEIFVINMCKKARKNHAEFMASYDKIDKDYDRMAEEYDSTEEVLATKIAELEIRKAKLKEQMETLATQIQTSSFIGPPINTAASLASMGQPSNDEQKLAVVFAHAGATTQEASLNLET